MLEFRRNVNQVDVWNDKKTKTFYIWLLYRLLPIQLYSIICLSVTIYYSYQIFSFWMMADILMYEDIILLIVFFLFVFGLVPRIAFFFSRIKSTKAFGNTYELIITKDSCQIGENYFSLAKKKTIVCKKGIAIWLTKKIVLLLPIHILSNEEYVALKKWLKKE